MPNRLTIIIPCFNQGQFLAETLESVLSCDPSVYELIIVNDGSTDEATNQYIDSLVSEGYNVIKQENKGLAGARNAGLKMAKGEFILPLDSDNTITNEYLVQAIKAMDADPQIGVVYGNARYFGSKTGEWNPGPFNLQKLMITNYIDACAVIRKSVFEKVGGYDTGMKYMGWEDWDLWLRIAFAGYKFHHINKVVWGYRVLDNSMSKQVYNAYEKPNTLENYVNEKYPDKLGHAQITDYVVRRFRASPFSFVVKLVIRTYFPSYYKKLLSKNKIRNGI